MQVNLNNKYGNKFVTNKNDKAIFLFFGLAMWLVIPILGIFPLLFFVHLNRKPHSKLNYLVCLLIVLTITIFVSSLDVISDLAVYIDNYEYLAKKNPFEISGGKGLEFVMWVVSYPIYVLTNGSRYAFIFFWSFVFNAITFFVIVKGFSPRNYGLLLLFIVATPNFLGYQGFLVRQYLATIIFLVAVVNLENKLVFWSIYLFSLFAHVANLLYLPAALLYDKVKILYSKTIRILFVLAGLTLTFSTSVIFDLAQLLQKVLPGQYGAAILAKTYRYSREQTASEDLGIAFVEHLLIFSIVIFLVRYQQMQSDKERLLIFSYPIFLFLMFIGRNVHLFSNRFAFILFPFTGLFYYLLIEFDWKFGKRSILTLLLVGKMLYFSYFLVSIDRGDIAFNYMDNRALSSNVFDYIESAYDGFTDDIKIKELPTDRSVTGS